MRWLRSLSIKYKIFLIPFVGLVGFAVIILINNSVNSNNAHRLASIRDMYFPVLEKADASIVKLERITETLNSAVSTGEMDMIDSANDMRDEILEIFDQIITLYPEKKEVIEKLISEFSEYYAQASQLSTSMVDGTADFSALNDQVEGMGLALEKLKQSMAKFRGDSHSEFIGTVEKTTDDANQALVIGGIVSAVVVVLLLVTSLSVTVMITRNIAGVVDSLRDIASGEGDLTKRISQHSQDEIGQLVASFNHFIERLQEIITEVIDSVEPLISVSELLEELTQQTEQMSATQLSTTKDVTHSISQVFESVKEVAESASSAATAAQQADSEAQVGQGVVIDTVETINQLAMEVEKAVKTNRQLEADTEGVGSILDVIQGIAEQVNLLALNAAIEAARAGEHGRGFAVVADEVRTLASRTQESTKQIHQVIDQLRRTASTITDIMEANQNRAKECVSHVGKTGESLAAITTKVGSISDMNHQIASSTEEQQRTTQEIFQNIDGIKELTERSAAMSNEVARETQSLTDVTAKLQKVAQQFRV